MRLVRTEGYPPGGPKVVPAQNAASAREGEAPLRILMAASRFYPSSGGTETHVYEVSRRLAAEGHKVVVLTADTTGELPAHEEKEGFEVRRIRAWPRNRDYFFAPRLCSAIARGKFDLIHVQGYHTLFAPLAMLCSILKRVPFVITFHSGGHSSALRNRIRPLQMRVLSKLVGRAERFIAVSKFEGERFAQGMGLPRPKFTVIYNGCELPPPTPGIVPDANLIVSMGRLEKYKGHQLAIEALAKLKAQLPGAHLKILGSGPYEEDLRRLASLRNLTDSVEITSIPPSNRQKLSDTLARAGLVVLLSEYEANPIAVMEAISLGRPVLATDCTGFKELIGDGLISAVPLNANPGAIAAAMASELEKAHQSMRRLTHDWQDCASQLLTLYRSVLRQAGRGAACQGR